MVRAKAAKNPQASLRRAHQHITEAKAKADALHQALDSAEAVARLSPDQARARLKKKG